MISEGTVTGRQGQRVTTTSSRKTGSDLKRALDRRNKVKVSALLSPESQQAMLLVRQEARCQQRTSQPNKPVPKSTVLAPVPVPVPVPVPSAAGSRCASDDVSEAEHVGFGALLDRVCTTRLHGDITDKNFTPRLSRKRALRSGDRLHTAMEVVEIVRYDCDDNNGNAPFEDSDDEQEAIRRAADVSCQERCQAWVELHFDSDDTSSLSSADR